MLGARPSELRNFARECLVVAGASPKHATIHADLLVTADERGINSHGLNRLDMYLAELDSGSMTKGVEPKIINDMPATALVNGCGGLGGYVGNFCMDLAIQKAKTCGIGMVVCCNSNHFGIAGYYALQASRQGMIGISMTNSRKLVVPTRAAPPPAIGTNPICCSAPGITDTFTLDMATSTGCEYPDVELCQRKGTQIPVGWGVDGSGFPTTDPTEVLNNGGLSPLGGDEEHRGYKGYGLAMMVDILCGVLSGGKCGPNLGAWRKAENQGPADISHCFIAINPVGFNPDFQNAVQGLINTIHALPQAENLPVLVPGDPEIEKMKQQQELVLYNVNVVKALEQIACQLKVPFPNFQKV